MAVIRDVMPAFELFQPASIEDAQAVLDRYGANAWVLAGGLDSFDWLKDRIKRPQALVDLAGIPELKGIRPWQDGLEIGAMTTLTEVVRHPVVRERYAILLEAAESAASPQIRNQGTIGGNVSQDTRCWYYRAGWPCYRAGGNICYADTPEAINREHAILGADRCVAVSPSDTAPALIALDAQMVVRTAGGGELTIAAEDYFIGPATDITRMTILAPGDLLTAIRLPGTWGGAQFYFEKVRDRAGVGLRAGQRRVGDDHERIGDRAHAACGQRRRRPSAAARSGRGHRPRQAAQRSHRRGRGQPGDRRGAAAEAFNAYKVPLMRNLVKRAIRGVEAGTWTS